PVIREAGRLAVDLGHQRAGRVDRAQAPLVGPGAHAGGNTVRREHADRALGHFGLLLDEDRPSLAQLGDDVLVVHDLLAHIHRRAVQLERAFDRLNGAIDARTVAARSRQEKLLNRVGHLAPLYEAPSYASP